MSFPFLRGRRDCFAFPMGQGKVPWEKDTCGALWPALSVSAMRPIASGLYYAQMGASQARFIHNPYCHSHYYSLDWDTGALFTFVSSRRFFQLKKVFCFTNYISCYHYNLFGKILGTFRSTKDIVKKCLSDKGEKYCALQLCPNCSESRVCIAVKIYCK